WDEERGPVPALAPALQPRPRARAAAPRPPAAADCAASRTTHAEHRAIQHLLMHRSAHPLARHVPPSAAPPHPVVRAAHPARAHPAAAGALLAVPARAMWVPPGCARTHHRVADRRPHPLRALAPRDPLPLIAPVGQAVWPRPLVLAPGRIPAHPNAPPPRRGLRRSPRRGRPGAARAPGGPGPPTSPRAPPREGA